MLAGFLNYSTGNFDLRGLFPVQNRIAPYMKYLLRGTFQPAYGSLIELPVPLTSTYLRR